MQPLTCSICGRPCFKDAIVSVEPIIYAMCAQCYSQCGTCAMCKEAHICDFETNSSSLPKQVQQTSRQGNMVMQTVVKNPERIRITCEKGCKCWSDEFGCLKQNGSCGNYEEVIPNDGI